jgi:hypothetical protein
VRPPTIDQLRNLVNRAGDGGLTPAEADRLREGFELLAAAALPDTAPDGPRAASSSPLAASGAFGGDREGRGAPGASQGRTGDPGPGGPRQAA